MSTTQIPALPREERELLHRLLRGASVQDVAWSGRVAPEQVLERARAVIYVSAPDLLAAVGESKARRITDLLLGLQSPGQAAGTEDLLRESADARRWALWVREYLADLYPHGPPPVEGLSDALPRPVEPPGRSSPRARRRARQQEEARKEARAIEAAGAAMFRPEALEHHRDGAGRIALPQFRAGRRVVALGVLMVLLVAVVGAGLAVRVPEYRTQVASVVPTPAGSRLLLPATAEDLERIEVGSRIRWQIGDEDGPTATVTAITRDRLTPERAEERYDLGASGAALVPTASRLVLAETDGRPLPVGTAGQARLEAADRPLLDLLRP